MEGLSIYEFDVLVAESAKVPTQDGVHAVPDAIYQWLEEECQHLVEGEGATWLRWSRRGGARAVQVTSFAGVIQAPGYHIEVLPKIGKALDGGHGAARGLLLDMLVCLETFRHVKTHQARVLAARMPMLEVFIAEFLDSVRQLIRHGIRSDYREVEGNLYALRGRLLISSHLRYNLCRPDRFYTAHDEFVVDRAENRLIRSALGHVVSMSREHENIRLGRELLFAFDAIPASSDTALDFQRVRLDRGMEAYHDTLDWCALILTSKSPLAAAGSNRATSLLFPMEVLFESLVAAHIPRQLAAGMRLQTQARSKSLVRHAKQDWFQLRPDLVVHSGVDTALVLDTKWKLVDASQGTATLRKV